MQIEMNISFTCKINWQPSVPDPYAFTILMSEGNQLRLSQTSPKPPLLTMPGSLPGETSAVYGNTLQQFVSNETDYHQTAFIVSLTQNSLTNDSEIYFDSDIHCTDNYFTRIQSFMKCVCVLKLRPSLQFILSLSSKPGENNHILECIQGCCTIECC